MRQKNLLLKGLIVRKFGTQADFSSVVGIREGNLSRIINGRREPTPEEAQTIAKSLVCKVEELFPPCERSNSRGGNP